MRKSSLSKYFQIGIVEENKSDEVDDQGPKPILKKRADRPSSFGHSTPAYRESINPPDHKRKSLTWGKSKVLEFIKNSVDDMEQPTPINIRNRKLRRASYDRGYSPVLKIAN
jgi:hypothetical protein